MNKKTNNLNRTANSIGTILTILETDQPCQDWLAFNFRAINAYEAIKFKNSGHQSLISISTDFIQDSELHSEARKFHTSYMSSSKALFEEIHFDCYSYMIDYYRKGFTTVFIEHSLGKLVPNNFVGLKKMLNRFNR